MPNNRLLVRPDLVVVDSSKEPEEKEGTESGERVSEERVSSIEIYI